MLINKQSLSNIIGRTPATDWKQWVTDRPNLIQGTVKHALKKFMEKKYKDVLNVIGAEPVGWGSSIPGPKETW
jgi:hypothetical protein